jgi:hypothetical protein
LAKEFGNPRTICNYTETSPSVKPLAKVFLGAFPQGVESEENPRISRFLGAFGRASPASILNFFSSASAVQGGTTLTERQWTSLGSVH